MIRGVDEQLDCGGQHFFMGDQDCMSTMCKVCLAPNVSTNQQCSFLPQGQSTILAPSLQLHLWFRNNGVAC